MYVISLPLDDEPGEFEEVSFPDKANKPNPVAWLFLSIDFVIKTLLADWIGPMNNPFIDARIKNIILALTKRIIPEEIIKPIREKIMTDFEPNLSFANPPRMAPIKAVIFINIDKISKSLISKLKTWTANIPPITIMAFNPSA